MSYRWNHGYSLPADVYCMLCQPLITCKRLSGLIYCMGSARFSLGKICETSYSFIVFKYLVHLSLLTIWFIPEGNCKAACIYYLIVVFFCFFKCFFLSISTFSVALEVGVQIRTSKTKHTLGKVLILISLMSVLWIVLILTCVDLFSDRKSTQSNENYYYVQYLLLIYWCYLLNKSLASIQPV